MREIQQTAKTQARNLTKTRNSTKMSNLTETRSQQKTRNITKISIPVENFRDNLETIP